MYYTIKLLWIAIRETYLDYYFSVIALTLRKCLLKLKRNEILEERMTVRLLDRQQVESLVRLSRSSIYRLMRDGLFPAPIRIGERAVRWPENEIDEWLETRPRATGDFPTEKRRSTGGTGA